MRRLLHLRLLLTVLVVALVAACSGGDEPSTTDDAAAPSESESTATEAATTEPPEEEAASGNVLAAAVDSSVDASSRFQLTSTVDTPQGEITTTGEGVSAADGSSRITLTVDGAGAQVPGQEGPLEIETIFVDSVIYQRIPGFGAQLGTDAEWFSIDAEAQIPGIGQLIEQAESADPTEGLQVLQQVAEVEEVGSEEVNGVATTRYAATARLGDLIEASGLDVDQMGLDSGELDVDQQIPMDVWVDDDGRVRRLVQEFELQGASVSTTLDFLEYGIDADITPPPAEDTADLAELIEQAQQGAAGEGAGADG